MARLLRRAFVWFFTGIGVLTTVGAAALYFLGSQFGEDPLDRTEVVAVIPAPGGSEAAVVYLRHHADSSRDFVEVKRIRQPFPRIGSSINSRDNVLTLSGGATVGWHSGKTPNAGAEAAKLVEISWKGSQLLLCPAENSSLIAFNGGYFDNDTTLCSKQP